jgi:hypothetical protein
LRETFHASLRLPWVTEIMRMPRYYFHIRDHEKVIPDDEGVDLPGVKAAFDEAQDAAREILATKVRRGEVIDGHKFEVRDELDKQLFTLPFKSVLRLE